MLKIATVAGGDCSLFRGFVGDHAAQRFGPRDGELHVPEVGFGRKEFYANIWFAVARAMNGDHAALHGLARVIIDKDYGLSHKDDFFQLKQGPVAIDGLRDGMYREAFSTVGLPKNGERDGQSHP